MLAMGGVGAIVAHAESPLGGPKTFQVAAGFEEVLGNTAEHYLWKNSGTAVLLGAGGRLSIVGSAGSGGTGSEEPIGFAGASLRSEARGEIPTESKTVYYLGRGEAWRTATHFARVRYAGIYPGIDLVFVTAKDRLEYNFEVAPYADPSAIRIGDDRSSFTLTPEGDLEVHSGQAVFTERRPLAFQTVAGRRRPIECAFRAF